MFRYLKRLGLMLSLGHHSQGLLLVLAVFFLLIKAWWSLPGLVLYGIMHFQYGGSGTFQRPPRDDQRSATIADLFYVTVGIGGLALMVTGLGKRIVETFG